MTSTSRLAAAFPATGPAIDRSQGTLALRLTDRAVPVRASSVHGPVSEVPTATTGAVHHDNTGRTATASSAVRAARAHHTVRAARAHHTVRSVSANHIVRTATTNHIVRTGHTNTTGRTRTVTRSVIRHVAAPSRQRAMRFGNMTAVIAYAKSQLGARYVSGGEGGGGFDCSGLTKRAYARAGIQLPHSSRAQAARARRISRGQARAGDLVVGSGHVGIYMGRGMMIDAGNHRTGVVYRRLYSGLSLRRLR